MVFAALVPAKSCVEWNYWRILFFCSSVWFFYLHFYVSSWRVFYTHAYAGIFHCNENKDFSFVLLSAKSSEAIFLRLSSVGHFLRWNNWATALFVKKKKKSFHCRRTWEDQARYFGKKTHWEWLWLPCRPPFRKGEEFSPISWVSAGLCPLFEHSINQTFPLSSILTNSFWPLAIESNVFSNFSCLCWSFSMPVSDIKVVKTLKVIKIKVDWSKLRKFCWHFEDPAPPHKHWLLQNNSSDLYSFH